MSSLTNEDRARIARSEAAFARPPEQWVVILQSTPDPLDAAARIFGDLRCFTADRNRRGYPERRDGFGQDVVNLARALDAWATLRRHNTTG